MNKTQHKPKISIIVPVYNAGLYIKTAVESVIAQNVEPIELILVDDNSTDNSGFICEVYSKSYNWISYIKNTENLGASKARNKGIDLATGEYIMFLDADDVYRPNILQLIMEEIVDGEIEFIKFGFIEVYYDSDCNKKLEVKCEVVDREISNHIELMKAAIELELQPAFGYIWNSVYKLDLIKEKRIFFDNRLIINEDFKFNIDYCSRAQKSKMINFCGYEYSKRDNGSLSYQKNVNYYESSMMKVNSFLKWIDSGDIAEGSIYEFIVWWLYTRYIWSTLSQAIDDGYKMFRDIYEVLTADSLYSRFKSYDQCNFGTVKQKLLMKWLKLDNILYIYCISYVLWLLKYKLGCVFARIKR